jgi:hypothetical protein
MCHKRQIKKFKWHFNKNIKINRSFLRLHRKRKKR